MRATRCAMPLLYDTFICCATMLRRLLFKHIGVVVLLRAAMPPRGAYAPRQRPLREGAAVCRNVTARARVRARREGYERREVRRKCGVAQAELPGKPVNDSAARCCAGVRRARRRRQRRGATPRRRRRVTIAARARCAQRYVGARTRSRAVPRVRRLRARPPQPYAGLRSDRRHLLISFLPLPLIQPFDIYFDTLCRHAML